MTDDRSPLLQLEDLSLSFPALRGDRTLVVDGVSFDVARSETLGLVGESGSGKTVTALAVMGLSDPRARLEGGRVLLDGRDLLRMAEGEKRSYRGGRVGMIFQAPKASLNPLLRVGRQVSRVVRHHRHVSGGEARDIAIELLQAVGIEDAARRYRSYPHQLSGGMAQRVLIAMALAAEPELLIADEPTTGLDVTIQAQIFDLLLSFQKRLEMSLLLITHDLALVAETCQRVVVMHGGHVVEIGPVEAIFKEPKHPYTQRLLGTVLRADRRVEVTRGLQTVDERIIHSSTGCRYVAKCERAFGPCEGVRPALLPVGTVRGHFAMCHLYDEGLADARKADGAAAAAG
jgi:peptide/nickel transport system ATP-binding protein